MLKSSSPGSDSEPKSGLLKGRICTPLTVSILILILWGCRPEGSIPPAARQQIEPNAIRFCQLTVECMRQDMSQRMANEPQRRFYLAGRMTQGACVDAQIRSLMDRKDDLASLSACTDSLARITVCPERLAFLRTEATCRQALQL